MTLWQKIISCGSIILVLLSGYLYWQPVYNNPNEYVTQEPLAGSFPEITISDSTSALQFAVLKEKAKTCDAEKQEREHKYIELKIKNYNVKWRQLLESGVALDELYRQAALEPELEPYMQNLFDQASFHLASELQLIVLEGTEHNIEQLFADINIPAQEPVTAAQWEQTLNNFSASTNFYKMVFLNQSRHWHQSRVISPSLIFIANIDKVEPSVATRLLNQLTFYPTQIAQAIQQNIDESLLEIMLQRGEQLTMLPLFWHQPESTAKVFNLADVALRAGRENLLPLLARFNIEPTQSVGLYSGIDNYLAGVDWQNRQRDMREQCQGFQDCFALKNEQAKIIQQLAQAGHQLHSPKVTDGLPQILLWLDAMNHLEDWQSNDNSPPEKNALAPIDPAPANRQDEVWQEIMSDIPDCAKHAQDLMLLEAFWDHQQINALLNQYKERYSGTALISALHDNDPALVVALQKQEMNVAVANMSRKDVEDYLTLGRIKGSLADTKQFTEEKPLSAYVTTELLFLLIYYPEDYSTIWEHRVAPVAPQSLLNFIYAEVAQWQKLVANRFDFRLLDYFGLSLYYAAFRHTEVETVVRLLREQGVPLQLNTYGPDAIHLALDWSYQNGQLFPLLAEWLTEPVVLNESHYRRLRRLQLFYPERYAELQLLVPKLVMSESAGDLNHISSL
ncbi:MAG: hypothetical protein ACK4GU_16660 [Alishewanella aestuarii]